MSRHRQARQESTLAQRLAALNDARELGEGRVDDAALQHVYNVLDRATSRRSLSAEHTVVGFFGATGSGKSSLFNAVARTDAAVVAYRRPTTSEPLAMVWSEPGSADLLDWLEVADRRSGAPVEKLADDGVGLILLDLPDFDSTTEGHREIVQQLAGQVDVLVWVVDPQKYADAVIHREFIRPFSAHGAVTLVVLNQVDKLAKAEVKPVLESLKGLLLRDGLGKMPVMAVSATTGEGINALRKDIGAVAASKAAQSQRLAADVEVAARTLRESSGAGEAAGIHQQDRQMLAERLATAAHADVVVDAVRASYKIDATRHTGWPATRWLARFRRDPLRRLSLRREDAAELNRTTLPQGGAVEQAQLDSGVRTFADAVSLGAPGPWRSSIRAVARSGRSTLADSLDQAVAHTDLKANAHAWWWPIFSVLQWLSIVAAVAGLGWLAVLAVLGYMQLNVPKAPVVEGWPVPTLLLVAGVVLGIFLAAVSKVLAAVGARGRAALARKRLLQGVAEVAEQAVIAPTEAELARYRDFQAALAAAE